MFVDLQKKIKDSFLPNWQPGYRQTFSVTDRQCLSDRQSTETCNGVEYRGPTIHSGQKSSSTKPGGGNDEPVEAGVNPKIRLLPQQIGRIIFKDLKHWLGGTILQRVVMLTAV